MRDDFHEILFRRFVAGQDSRQVAAAMGVDRATVDRRLQDLRTRLSIGEAPRLPAVSLRFHWESSADRHHREVLQKTFGLQEVRVAPNRTFEGFPSSRYARQFGDRELDTDRLARQLAGMVAAGWIEELATRWLDGERFDPWCQGDLAVGVGSGMAVAELVHHLRLHRVDSRSIRTWGIDSLPGLEASVTAGMASVLARRLGAPTPTSEGFTQVRVRGESPLTVSLREGRDAVTQHIQAGMNLCFMGVGAPAPGSSSLVQRIEHSLMPPPPKQAVGDVRFQYIDRAGRPVPVPGHDPSDHSLVSIGWLCGQVRAGKLLSVAVCGTTAEPKRKALYAALRMGQQRPFNGLVVDSLTLRGLLERAMRDGLLSRDTLREEAPAEQDYWLGAAIRALLLGLSPEDVDAREALPGRGHSQIDSELVQRLLTDPGVVDSEASRGAGAHPLPPVELRASPDQLEQLIVRCVLEKAFRLGHVRLAPVPSCGLGDDGADKAPDVARAEEARRAIAREGVHLLDALIGRRAGRRRTRLGSCGRQPQPFGVALGSGMAVAALAEAFRPAAVTPSCVAVYGVDLLPGLAVDSASGAVCLLADGCDLPLTHARLFAQILEDPPGNDRLSRGLHAMRDSLRAEAQENSEVAFFGIGTLHDQNASSLWARISQLLGGDPNLEAYVGDVRYVLLPKLPPPGTGPWFVGPPDTGRLHLRDYDGSDLICDPMHYTVLGYDALAAWRHQDHRWSVALCAGLGSRPKREALLTALRQRRKPMNALITDEPTGRWLAQEALREFGRATRDEGHDLHTTRSGLKALVDFAGLWIPEAAVTRMT